MSVNNGLLLFDLAEPSINGWHENIRTRGMYEKWEKGNRFILISFDDEAEEWEAWTGDEEDGDWETIAWGTFEEYKKAITEHMNEDQEVAA